MGSWLTLIMIIIMIMIMIVLVLVLVLIIIIIKTLKNAFYILTSRCFLQLKEITLTQQVRFQSPFKTINKVTLFNGKR